MQYETKYKTALSLHAKKWKWKLCLMSVVSRPKSNPNDTVWNFYFSDTLKRCFIVVISIQE